MRKPEFREINYDPNTICWGMGNHVVGPRLIARIQLREAEAEQEFKLKEDYERAEEIYDRYINVGQKFKPSGENANNGIVVKVTYIHAEKQLVTWKQVEFSEEFIHQGLKPAKGKWTINSMIHLYNSGRIEFI